MSKGVGVETGFTLVPESAWARIFWMKFAGEPCLPPSRRSAGVIARQWLVADSWEFACPACNLSRLARWVVSTKRSLHATNQPILRQPSSSWEADLEESPLPRYAN